MSSPMVASTSQPSSSQSVVSSVPAAKPAPSPWKHLVGGGLAGMAGAIVTSPLDVVKTRLQSSIFQEALRQERAAIAASAARSGAATATLSLSGTTNLLWHFVETGHLLREIQRVEGTSALFKGLGPTLAGVIPARSINFFTYGNGKLWIADHFNGGKESTLVHLAAAASAGIVTGTATNPIWVVKTRLQLEKNAPQAASKATSVFSGVFRSTNMAVSILKREGVRGLYKGLSASYLGVTEGTIQWTLYERLKKNFKGKGGTTEWLGTLASAGGAKFVASLITYPHEVLRTRLRQDPPLVNGRPVPKYTGLVQTLKLVIAEEGAAALYGGLSAHLLRVIPNAAVMYTLYEGFIRYF